jgi:PAS domain-containing protein
MAHPIQIILTRQLIAYLSVPVYLFDPDGNLIFYNEAAETIVGTRFDETGPMPLEEWWSVYSRFDIEGKPVRREDHHVMISLKEKRPISKRIHFKGADGAPRSIDATSIPITGLDSELLGAVVIFWEVTE